MTDLVVAPCDHKAAKYAVEHWHYSRCLPHQKLVKLGVWESAAFRGVIVFGDGANAGMFSPYGLKYTEGCELVRIALAAHELPVTQVVSVAIREVKRLCPGLRIIASFADPEQGHFGGIYQAGNWIYTGLTDAADEYIVNGKRMHGRALRSTRSTHRAKNIMAANILEWARKILDPNATIIKGTAKHRYLYPLDRAMRRQIQKLAQPYPKRAAEVSTRHA